MSMAIDSIHSLPPRQKKRRGQPEQKTEDVGPEEDQKSHGWEQRKNQFEYLDHTADVQIHSWGRTFEEACEFVVVGMFGVITELDYVEIDDSLNVTITAKGHDMASVLFAVLDEFLFSFCSDYHVCKDVRVINFDKDNWTVTAIGRGEIFSLDKHPQGTEVKAITYSNMQIFTDFKTPQEEAEADHANFPVQLYVIVDI